MFQAASGVTARHLFSELRILVKVVANACKRNVAAVVKLPLCCTVILRHSIFEFGNACPQTPNPEIYQELEVRDNVPDSG